MKIKKLITRELNKENQKYLKNNWFLVGAKSEFLNQNDFKTFELFNEPIIIFKFKNEVSAFTNICPHRGSRLKTDSRGNQILNCIYHGWSFNSAGKFISAPYQKETFTTKQLKNKSIKKWKLDFCGNLIFITKNNNKMSLKAFLGKKYDQIKLFSQNVNTFVHTDEYIWNCNWKLAVENSIDEYHGPILHKNTFKTTLKLKPSYTLDKKVLSMETPLNDNYVKSITNKKFLFKTNEINEKFLHFLFFPNTTFATTMGIFSFLQTYFPISSEQTKVTTSIFLCDTKNENSNKILIETMKHMAIKFNKEVFMEDKIIAEDLHKNIINGFEFSNFGNFENRIKQFRKLL